MWCWKRLGIGGTDCVISEVLYSVKEKRDILVLLNEIRLPGYTMLSKTRY